jgi:predicted enzyme related to lactoylglutathione lyase
MPVKSICGTILMSANPDALARFYGEALGLSFEREDHGGLAPHWGVDIGNVHFAIHPPENFKRKTSGQGSVVLTFDVPSLAECQARLERLGAPCIQPPHDEGFGRVASFNDPEGNLFEVVELTYTFGGAGG